MFGTRVSLILRTLRLRADHKRTPYAGPLNARVREIITNAMFGFQVHSIRRHKRAAVNVVATWVGEDKYLLYPDLRRELAWTFGEGAADGWMEGDIDLRDGTDDELDLEFVRVKITAPSSAKKATTRRRGGGGGGTVRHSDRLLG